MAAENAVTVPAPTSAPASQPSSSEPAKTPETPSSTSSPAPKKSPAERALEAFRASKTGEEKPPEVKPAAEPPKAEAKPAEPSVDDRLAQLDKGFRNLNKREQELRAETEKRKAELAELDEYKKLKARAKLDPNAWLKAGGIEFDQVVLAAAAKDGKPPNLEVLEAQERIAALEKKLADQDKQTEEQKQQAAEKAGKEFVATYRATLAEQAKANAEKYDLITAHGDSAIDFALQLADEYAIQHKRVPRHEEMLDIAERFLYDEALRVAQGSKKLKGDSAATKVDPPQISSGKAAPASPKKPPTLNNGLQGNAPAREAVNPRKLTGTERVRWALESTRRS